jgi:glucose dehydrogenase
MNFAATGTQQRLALAHQQYIDAVSDPRATDQTTTLIPTFDEEHRVHYRARSLILLTLALAASNSYVIAQSTEGEEVFQSHCVRCHAPAEMSGRLTAAWIGKSAEDLYQRVKTTMPAETPGSRSDSEYLAVTAHILALADMASAGPIKEQAQLAKITIQAPAKVKPAVGPDVDWTEFNGNLAAQRYSPLDQINAGNVAKLAVAWRWQAGMFGPSPELKNVSSPIVAEGKMFATVGTTRDIVGIDAGTGQLLWMWRADEGERFDNAARKGSGRGVAYWRSGSLKRVFTITPGYTLAALDPETGKPDPRFGSKGLIDLRQGLRLAKDRDDLDIGFSFPPLILNDVIVVGSAMRVAFRPPSKANVKGDVRGFDAHTGKLLWTFKTIPDQGEAGAETWLKGSNTFTGNAGVWSAMSGDPELGIVYLPVEAATGDRYGGDRPGANLFANSLVALDVKTGKMKWQYQIIHHDIWDWDNPAAPILADLPGGKKIVVQLTKQSFAYTFDRVTGKPIWPIRERKVPQSDVPGEWTSPTQPFPTKPAAYDVQGISEKDLIDFTPEVLGAAKAAIKPYRLGPLYTPASLADAKDGTKGTLSLPSSTGGANWEGGALDPESGILYVPSRTAVDVLALINDPKVSSVAYIQGSGRPPRVFDTLPLARPPWGRITAIDMNSGDHLWWIPNADTPKEVADHPKLKGVALPRTGIATRSGLLLTKTLLFAGEGWGGSAVLRAHDKKTGKILAEVKLPASQGGQPITYFHKGKQYIALFVGDGKTPGELIALNIPDEKKESAAAAPRRAEE